MKTPSLSPQEIREVVQGWMEGEELEYLIILLDRKGKPKGERFLKRLFMGVIHQKITTLQKSHSYYQACIRYRRAKQDDIFGEFRE
jgi:hypothetical protein